MTLTPVSSTLTHIYPNRLQVCELERGPENRNEGDPDGDGRTLVGLAVPFDVELDVADWWEEYTEVFRKGSFAKTIRDRGKPVPLLISHEHRGLPIGVSTELAETDEGLRAAFHLARTAKADEVLELVRADAISGLSIGFEPTVHRVTPGEQRTPPSRRDLHERTEVRLREVSVCNFPAYTAAAISEVRAAQERHPSLGMLAEERARLHELRSIEVDRFGRVVRH